MTTVAIVQARMTSTRLPGKVLAELNGAPMLQHMLARVGRARRLDAIWVATTTRSSDDPVAALCDFLKVPVFRGDEDDVLGRYLGAAEAAGASVIVRLTADCPMIDPEIIDQALEDFASGAYDYLSNPIENGYPDGLDVEVFSRAALKRAAAEARHPSHREHVTPYMRAAATPDDPPSGEFRVGQSRAPADFSHLRWTVDTEEDLERVRDLVAELPADYGWHDVLALVTRRPELQAGGTATAAGVALRPAKVGDLGLPLASLNAPDDLAEHGRGAHRIERFERSNALFRRTREIIPLASQTFSKSHQQMVAGAAPLFIESGKGCRVRDPDGNEYIDYVMGLLPVILGYGDADVDGAIRAALDDGIVFSLPSPLEAELAERLVRLIPCAEQVRFGKNGADATTAAIRLARAHTGRDKVALAGYHGWQDWSIGTTTRHLGVPDSVRELSHTFPFNDAEALETLLKADPDGFAAIILEPAGRVPPAPGFLETLRELATRYGAVLIFDEIVTGFRIAMGGAQAHYGVTPDLATFGKSMANGMPISAVVGRADLMALMEDIFFSTTFGGETLSIAAAIATLDKLEREDVPARLWRRGDALAVGLREILDRRGLGNFIRVEGEGWWPHITVDDAPVDDQLLISLLRQEYVANGLLLLSSFNLCLAHDNDAITEETFTGLDAVLGAVQDALASPDPASHLRGEAVRPTFQVRR